MAITLYKPIIGLEVHAQLLTQTKMFAPEQTSYGAMPNTNVSAITLAHPGTLPSINKKAINHTIRMGIACHAKITKNNHFARKNYFYPDLPKGYQITQDKTPLCTQGYITLPSTQNHPSKKIRIHRIHLEEDTGKSLHDLIPDHTLLDYNRAGTPLIEIVSEADIASPEEAYEYLKIIRQLLRYLDICDGNMEEGSMRCDANVSVMRSDATQWGEKVEVKNMNSLTSVRDAIQHEIRRQTTLLQQGKAIKAATRRFDATTGTTIHQRSKETLSEYRYFPEPDLSPFVVDQVWIEKIKKTMPPLPNTLFKKFTQQYKINTYSAQVLISDKNTALFFDKLCQHLTTDLQKAANWLLGPIKSYLNEQKITIDDFPLSIPTLAQLIQLVTQQNLPFSTVAQELLPQLIANPRESPEKIAEKLGLLQTNDIKTVNAWIDHVLAKHPDKVATYQSGKKGLLGFFIAEIREHSNKKADPKIVSKILKEKLC